jgi:P22_AR N-terminal domain
VPFLGQSLYVIEFNGEPYTPMKPIVEGMGMDWAAQYTKLKSRFNTCVVKITMQLPGDAQERDVTCLALRKLAAWLNTISPNKVRSEIRDRVLQYQEQCDDVLYEYWMKGHKPAKADAYQFDGRVLLTIEHGVLVRSEAVPEGYYLTSLEGFLELAKRADYVVMRKDELIEKLSG